MNIFLEGKFFIAFKWKIKIYNYMVISIKFSIMLSINMTCVHTVQYMIGWQESWHTNQAAATGTAKFVILLLEWRSKGLWTKLLLLLLWIWTLAAIRPIQECVQNSPKIKWKRSECEPQKLHARIQYAAHLASMTFHIKENARCSKWRTTFSLNLYPILRKISKSFNKPKEYFWTQYVTLNKFKCF